ncbi:MAG: permease, partial [Myxococcota bacterium]|nr:permease [Myxococcota bacterium]
MWSFVLEFLRQFIWAFSASAPYFLIGLLAAGVLRVFVPDELLVRWLGGSRRRGVLTASLLGVPIPICSCGIVPLSIGLRRKGAGRGATMAFLIATPETGVPSIALTWGLLGPLLAVIRPLVSWITAVLAGLFIEAADEEAGSLDGQEQLGEEGEDGSEGEEVDPACGSYGSANESAEDGCEEAEAVGDEPASPPGRSRTTQALHYGFVELLTELAPWLLVGLLLTALI